MKTPRQAELETIAAIKAKKKGKYIHIKCWTPSIQSSSETHAKSISAAVKFLRISAPHHSNWVMEFASE